MVDIYTVKHYIKTLKIDELIEKYVDSDKTLKYCRLCPKYETNYSCPEFTFNTIEYLKNYEYIELIVTQVTFSNNLLQKKYTPHEIEEILNKTYFLEEKKTQKEIYKREKYYRKAESLIGPCTICGKNCKNRYIHCQHPQLRRYSTESMGLLINNILEE